MASDYCFALAIICCFNLRTLPIGLILIGVAYYLKKTKPKKRRKYQNFTDSM